MTFGFKVFGWDVIEAQGPDVASWLGGIVTCDLPSAGSGAASWGLLLSKQGKIQADLLLVADAPERLSIVVRGGQAEAVRQVLDHHLVMEDVELGPVEHRTWALAFGAREDELAQLRAAGLAPLTAPLSPRGVVLLRGGDPGELTATLQASGQELVGSGWDEARVEFGLPLYGTDFGAGDNPHQAALERRAVSWQKGCYLGQEVVFMQDARGKVKRRLVRLRAPAGAVLAPGARVVDAAGADAGEVTTGAAGGGLARVQAPHFEPGASLLVDQTPVTVEALDAGLFGRTGPAGTIER